mgnify:CR=1 FL=1
MVKSSLAVKVIWILSFILYLLVPFYFCQVICLTVFFSILACFLYLKILNKYLVVERDLDTIRLTSGEQAEITFSIKNFSILPVLVCYVYDDVSYIYVYHNGNRDIILLRSKEIKKLSYTIHVQERGEFFAGPLTIKFTDPLNLFSFEKEIQSKMKIMVRPARIPLITEAFPGLPQGIINIKNICYEDITMRRSLREYQNGDELKRINWRASAKYGELFTNEYQDTFDVPFFVFVNLAEDDYRLDQRKYKMERALEIAAAIVEKSAVLKQRCGFAAFGSDFPYLKPAANQRDCILDIISVIKMAPGNLDYDPVQRFKNQLPFGTQLFVVGPKEVDFYDDMFYAEKTNMSTSNLKITREL